MDISAFMTDFISLMVQGVNMCFDFLDSFRFNGVTLLTFNLGVLFIGAVIPIVLTLIKSPSVRRGTRPNREGKNNEEN